MKIKPLESFRDEDGCLSTTAYYKQFQPIELRVGGVYRQLNLGKWAETHYKIIFIGEGVAVGIVVWDAISGTKNIGGAEMFYCDPKRPYLNGVKYNDTMRPCYRLSERIDK